MSKNPLWSGFNARSDQKVAKPFGVNNNTAGERSKEKGFTFKRMSDNGRGLYLRSVLVTFIRQTQGRIQDFSWGIRYFVYSRIV